jgi:hypothetical protein
VVERKSKARDNGERERKNIVTPQCPFLKFGGKKGVVKMAPCGIIMIIDFMTLS